MLTVMAQARIPAPVSHSWDCLTQPSLLKRWFADTDRFEPGREFFLGFGDGDFFAGAIKEWREPELLRLVWQLLGVGPEFEITYRLTQVSEAETELTVTDYGALTSEDAQSLSEGWQDFLTRLVKFIETGKSTRFRWSETISAGAVLQSLTGNERLREMSDHGWWRELFPDAVLSFEEDDGSFAINFQSEYWNGITTAASIQTSQFGFGSYLAVNHAGWANLPDTQQVSERSRYAGLWHCGLQALEDRYRSA
jgi:uncharacterized protein YndB with AHSA1/START domain